MAKYTVEQAEDGKYLITGVIQRKGQGREYFPHAAVSREELPAALADVQGRMNARRPNLVQGNLPLHELTTQEK